MIICGLGIPAAASNITEAKGLRDFFAEEKIDKLLINVPGCPPHPLMGWSGTYDITLAGGTDEAPAASAGQTDHYRQRHYFYSTRR